jgi:hypothetical protein
MEPDPRHAILVIQDDECGLHYMRFAELREPTVAENSRFVTSAMPSIKPETEQAAGNGLI